jgi:hypothetical protein
MRLRGAILGGRNEANRHHFRHSGIYRHGNPFNADCSFLAAADYFYEDIWGKMEAEDMIPEMERVGRIIVEKGEGKCWHDPFEIHVGLPKTACPKCRGSLPNPDFSEWANFGRLLKIAKSRGGKVWCDLWETMGDIMVRNRTIESDVDEIPPLLATELARIISEGKFE